MPKNPMVEQILMLAEEQGFRIEHVQAKAGPAIRIFPKDGRKFGLFYFRSGAMDDDINNKTAAKRIGIKFPKDVAKEKRAMRSYSEIKNPENVPVNQPIVRQAPPLIHPKESPSPTPIVAESVTRESLTEGIQRKLTQASDLIAEAYADLQKLEDKVSKLEQLQRLLQEIR